MFESLLAIFTGGASGLLGTVLSTVMDGLERRARHKREMELRRMDMEMIRMEMEFAQNQGALAAEGEALAASYAEAGRRWSLPADSGWLIAVDVVRGLTRPVLTLLFLGLTGAIYFSARYGVADIQSQIIDTVLYLTMTCTVWWFGSRRKSGQEGGQ